MSGETLKKVGAGAIGGPMGFMQVDAAQKQEKAVKQAQKEQAAELKEKKKRAAAERRSLIDQTRGQMGLDSSNYSLSRTGDKSGVKTLTGTLG